MPQPGPTKSDTPADVAEFEEGPVGPALYLEPKVTAGAEAGAVTVLLVFLAGQLGLEVPAEVASAVTTLIAFVAGFVRPS